MDRQHLHREGITWRSNHRHDCALGTVDATGPQRDWDVGFVGTETSSTRVQLFNLELKDLRIFTGRPVFRSSTG